MKIAYFLDVPKGLGGAGNVLLQQAVLMSELHDVIVVIPADVKGNYNYEYARRCEQYNMSYVPIEYSTAYRFSSIDMIKALNDAVFIEKFAKKEKINFFHTVQLNLAVEYVSRKLKIPHLMDIYQLEEHEFRICPGNIYPKYHLCDSIMYSNLWSRKLGIESRHIRPAALLDSIKEKKVYPKGHIKILMLGAICERKNQLSAIKAIEFCYDFIPIELHILGAADNSYAEECQEYVREHGLEEYIFIHGFISDVVPFLEKCDCLLCTSIDESFPSSMVEAVTYDLTIVSTPVAGVPEVFIDKQNSFISKDFTDKCIRQSIIECIEYYKTGHINIIHKNAQKTWRDNFERNIVRQEIDAYYKYISASQIFESPQIFSNIKEELEKTEQLLCGIDDCGETWMYKRSLYYTVLRKKLEGEKIYIWGAGKFGKLAFEILSRICPNMKTVAFIDANKKGSYYGIPIKALDDIPIEKNFFYSISFAKDREQAIQYLEKKGLILNAQIWIIP